MPRIRSPLWLRFHSLGPPGSIWTYTARKSACAQPSEPRPLPSPLITDCYLSPSPVPSQQPHVRVTMPIAYYNVHSVPGRVVQNSSAVVPGGIAGTARSLVCSPRTMPSFLPYTISDMLLSGHLLPFGRLLTRMPNALLSEE